MGVSGHHHALLDLVFARKRIKDLPKWMKAVPTSSTWVALVQFFAKPISLPAATVTAQNLPWSLYLFIYLLFSFGRFLCFRHCCRRVGFTKDWMTTADDDRINPPSLLNDCRNELILNTETSTRLELCWARLQLSKFGATLRKSSVRKREREWVSEREREKERELDVPARPSTYIAIAYITALRCRPRALHRCIWKSKRLLLIVSTAEL